jgi:hypothetical protein
MKRESSFFSPHNILDNYCFVAWFRMELSLRERGFS